MRIAIGDERVAQNRPQTLGVIRVEQDLRIDPMSRNLQDEIHGDDIGAQAAAESVHLGKARVVLPVQEKLNDQAWIRGLAPDGDEMPDVVEDLVEDRRLHLHHPRVVGGIRSVQRDQDLARLSIHQAPGHCSGHPQAVGGDVVDDQAARVNVVDHLLDLAMKQRVATACEAHRAEPFARRFVDDLHHALQGHLIFGPHIHGIAEIAVDVAAIADV